MSRKRAVCHDCGVLEGELHKCGCDMERCPFCNRQIITCGCVYELLSLYDPAKYDKTTCFLPTSTYEGGLNKAEDAAWQKLLGTKGRVPWIQYPNICIKCGILWPDMFSVPDEEWERYVESANQKKMLCQPCYLWIKELIEQC